MADAAIAVLAIAAVGVAGFGAYCGVLAAGTWLAARLRRRSRGRRVVGLGE
jgi:hypothetical protein